MSNELNDVCDLLNIEVPIFLGGMAHVSRARLVAAVSEAGGLGIIASAGLTPASLEEEIHKVKELTDKPFGVNLMLMESDVEEKASVSMKEEVDAVTTGAGNPAKVIKKLDKRGIPVFPVVPAVALARRVQRQGAAGVIAEGTEAGGHVGEVTTMVLVPAIVDEVDIPVIAAGGIADGRGMAAAFALGAKGVQIGTRFAASAESPIHPNFKATILEANERSTTVTGKSLGAPVRAIANEMTKEFSKLEDQDASREELENVASGGLKRAVEEGDCESGSLMAGQAASLVHEEETVEDIIERIMAQFNDVYAHPPLHR